MDLQNLVQVQGLPDMQVMYAHPTNMPNVVMMQGPPRSPSPRSRSRHSRSRSGSCKKPHGHCHKKHRKGKGKGPKKIGAIENYGNISVGGSVESIKNVFIGGGKPRRGRSPGRRPPPPPPPPAPMEM